LRDKGKLKVKKQNAKLQSKIQKEKNFRFTNDDLRLSDLF